MGVISCPYRGEQIPGLTGGKGGNVTATVCNHPAMRVPCVLARRDGSLLSCLDDCPKFWKDSPETATEKLSGLPVLDPSQWAQPEKPKQPQNNPLAILDCQHRGEYTGKTAKCPTGCSTKFKIFECGLHIECTIKSPGEGIVACCDTCPDRKPAGKPRPAAPQWLTIPRAPRLELKPVLKRAVVTIASGSEGKALHAISGPLMAAYADRIGADFVVLDWPGHLDWPMSAKYAIPRTLDDHLYERIAYVDADVIVPPDAVDLLKMCEPDEFGAFDELPFIRQQPKYKQEASYQQYRRMMKLPEVKHLPFYFNAGVMVLSRQHRELIEPPAKPMPSGHCREQDNTNANVMDAFLAGLVKVRQLDQRANRQNWCSAENFADALPGSLLHFSGGGPERKKRLELMRRWAEKFATTPASHPTA